MSARDPLKKLEGSHSAFLMYAEMVSKACCPDTPKFVSRLGKNNDKLDEAYKEVFHDYRVYKDSIGEDQINELDADGKHVHTYNDDWLSNMKEEYFKLAEKADVKLDEIAAAKVTTSQSAVIIDKEAESKELIKLQKVANNQYNIEKKSITDCVTSIADKVGAMSSNSIGVSQGEAIRGSLRELSLRLDGSLQDLFSKALKNLDTEAEEVFTKNHSSFLTAQKERIDGIALLVVNKTRESVADTGSRSLPAANHGNSGSGKTYLRKVDPPIFNGDCVEFPEFKRKWRAQVTRENMEEESELDRLRDCVPDTAKKMLVGEESLDSAWKILTKLYGNKTMIANKLKAKLKSIKSYGKQEHDIVINLAIEVRSIIKNLTELKMAEMLKYDDEYLSAIYKALPVREREKWLNYDKSTYETEWEAMEVFLEDIREKATNPKVLLSNYAVVDVAEGIRCRKCNKLGHKKAACTELAEVKIAAVKTSSLDEEDEKSQDLKNKLRDTIGKCPLCNSFHNYKRLKDKQVWPSDRFTSCDNFRKLSVEERAKVLARFKSCARCCSWKHDRGSAECRAPRNSCSSLKADGSKCTGDHSKMVCGTRNVYCAVTQVASSMLDSKSVKDRIVSQDKLEAETVMLLEDVPVKVGDKLVSSRVFWDDGSNRVLVNSVFAERNKLRKQPFEYRIKGVCGSESIESGMLYELDLMESSGLIHQVWGFGVSHIMDAPEPVDLSSIRSLFPHVPANIFEALAKKEIDVLIGLNYFSLHPSGGQGRNCVDNLRVLHSRFSKGWLVGGSHPDLKATKVLPKSALSLVQAYRVDVRPELKLNFWDGENLGVLPAKRCGRCLHCSDCQDSSLIHSLKEQEELNMLEKSIEIVDGQLQVTYPFIRNPDCLSDNRSVVVSMAEKVEKRLQKKGLLRRYNEEFQSYIDRGVIVPISSQEIAEYCGPRNYITHFGVEQPGSVTTKLRLVSHSSLKNGSWSLNECLPKGPNSLNSMFDVSVRFRCYEVGLVFDLSKAYHSMHTGLVEKHLRRLVWRFSDSEEWQDFGFVRVAFGDRPAATLLEIGKNITVESGKYIDPTTAKKLLLDSYVDDFITGGSISEVQKMQGVRLDNGQYSGTVCQMLKKGNLKVKVMVATGEADEEVKDTLGNKVLGYAWDSTSDNMAVKFPINVSGRVRKLKQKPDITADSLKMLKEVKLTKKICLGVTNSFVDFLGVACPFTLRFKLLMKQIFEDSSIGWNCEIGEAAADAWMELISEAVLTGSLIFPRTTRPKNAIGQPCIVSFDDGSYEAYSAVVYVRWKIECQHEFKLDCKGDFHSRLLCAKAKVTPLSGLTIPRSELCGMTLSSRLTLSSVRALAKVDELKPDVSIFLSDSECSISALENTGSSLKPYFHNRISEVKENMKLLSDYCKVEKFAHIAGKENVADIATHSKAKLSDLGPESIWQKGPLFLSWRRELWPTTRDFIKVDLPDNEVRIAKSNTLASVKMICAAANVKLASGVTVWSRVLEVMEYSNSLHKVKRILARVLRGWRLGKSSDIVSCDPVAAELDVAERMILMSAMPESFAALDLGKLDSLLPKKDGYILVTCGRLGERSLSRLLGVDKLPILMSNTRAAFLFMYRAHVGQSGSWQNLVHNSAVETLARSRSAVWVVRGKELARRIVKNCNLCIRMRKERCGQQIASIKSENLEVCRPWTYVSLDFAGPVICKGVVNARARRKCWILLYCCRSTKAVCMLPTAGYDTENFLIRHEEFIARKGDPKEIVSDQGSQLLAAGVVFAKRESPESWDWARIKRENCTSTWVYIPVGSQHHNGLPESMVKVLKKSLSQTLNPGVVLSYEELVTLLARISCSVNSRPLGLQNLSNTDQQEELLLPITPNHMLLGRSSPESPPLNYSHDDRFCRRLAFVAEVEAEWWRRWISTVLPTMLPAKKWKHEKENLMKGDVVMLTYEGNVKDDYVLAKVIDEYPDAKGLVRRVKVRFRKKNAKEPLDTCKSKMIEEVVAVQRLVLLQPVPRPTVLQDSNTGVVTRLQSKASLKK